MSLPSTLPQHESLEAVQGWLSTSFPGEAMTYWRGAVLPFESEHVAYMLRAGTSRQCAVRPSHQEHGKNTICGFGLCHLVQRKHGPFDYEYIAIKTKEIF
tara:strand:+ start:3005 stop:3304 length:300 start_codon:yes stop_codon:yes gene_type:complete